MDGEDSDQEQQQIKIKPVSVDEHGEPLYSLNDYLNQQIEEVDAKIDDMCAIFGECNDVECSYAKGYLKRQALYACHTCIPESKHDVTKAAGICLACSLHCHNGHDLIELYPKRNFRCDCGNSKFSSERCTLIPDKVSINAGNSYNQNFTGLYCICARPYPDPEDEIEDDMVTCVLCEDWFHTRHLGVACPGSNLYEEMVCQACMTKHDFLLHYDGLSMTKIEKQDEKLEVEVTAEDSVKADVSAALETKIEVHSLVITRDVSEDKSEIQETEVDGVSEVITKDVSAVITEDISAVITEDVSAVITEDVSAVITEDVSEDNAEIQEDTKTEKVASQSESTEDTSIEVREANSDASASKQLSDALSDLGAAEKLVEADSIEAAEKDEKMEVQESADKRNDICETLDDISRQCEEIDKALESESQHIGSPTENTPEPMDIEETEIETQAESKLEEESNNAVTSEETVVKQHDTEDQNTEVREDINTKAISDEKMDETDQIDTEKDEETDQVNTEKEEEEGTAQVYSEKEEETVLDSEKQEATNEINTKELMQNQEETVNLITENKEENEIELKAIEDDTKTGEKVEEKGEIASDSQVDESKVKASESESSCEERVCKKPKTKSTNISTKFFESSRWRENLCTCPNCTKLYNDANVSYLLDPQDTLTFYKEFGREAYVEGAFKRKMDALPHSGKLFLAEGMADFREKFSDFLLEYTRQNRVITTADVHAFFDGLDKSRKRRKVQMETGYYCR